MTTAVGSLRARLSAAPLVGAFVMIGHPAAVEAMAWRGFELLCIDGEHGSLGPAEIEGMIRAGDACGTRCLVRVAVAVPAIGHALDAGAAGVVVPRVETAAQAAECDALVRYPPRGVRGAGPGRAARYGPELAREVREANDRVLLVVQIETLAGVRAAAEIAAVDGVDVVFVGPGDLAVSLGCEPGSEEHTQAIRTVLAASRGAGTPTGIFVRTPDQMRPWAELGVRLFMLGGDMGYLGEGAGHAVAGARAVLADLAGGEGDGS